MAEKKNESVTSVRVEKRNGSAAKATVNNDGKTKSGRGDTAEEALSNAAKKSKD